MVVGSGPNGLAAALTLARAGLSVEVFEGAPTPGGGCRTQELTLPGFHHDVCSTIQSMVTISPFFRVFTDVSDAVTMLTPEVAMAHPLDDGRAGAVAGSVEQTASKLGLDGDALPTTVLATRRRRATRSRRRSWRRCVPPPRNPVTMARFGLNGLPSVPRTWPSASRRPKRRRSSRDCARTPCCRSTHR